jgi:hypothetical protein
MAIGMSSAHSTREDARQAQGRAFDADLLFLTRWAGPPMLTARVTFA